MAENSEFNLSVKSLIELLTVMPGDSAVHLESFEGSAATTVLFKNRKVVIASNTKRDPGVFEEDIQYQKNMSEEL